MASLQKPKKGILKTSSSFDKADHHRSRDLGKEMKWDEMNILATHHPPGKDYGHIKIDEPPTPYSKYSDQEDEDGDDMPRRGSFGASTELDPSSVASKLEDIEGIEGQRLRRVSTTDESSEEEEELTEEEKEKKRKFEQKRKLHYNEFQAVKLAKQLMEEEDEDDDEGNTNNNEGTGNDDDHDEEGEDDKDTNAMQTDSTEPDINRNVENLAPSGESSSSTGSPGTRSSKDPTQRQQLETEIF